MKELKDKVEKLEVENKKLVMENASLKSELSQKADTSEIESMKDEMNKEAGMDTSDGGVNVPQDTDGVTRYPSIDGSPISGDDLDAYDGAPPSDNGDN